MFTDRNVRLVDLISREAVDGDFEYYAGILKDNATIYLYSKIIVHNLKVLG